MWINRNKNRHPNNYKECNRNNKNKIYIKNKTSLLGDDMKVVNKFRDRVLQIILYGKILRRALYDCQSY